MALNSSIFISKIRKYECMYNFWRKLECIADNPSERLLATIMQLFINERISHETLATFASVPRVTYRSQVKRREKSRRSAAVSTRETRRARARTRIVLQYYPTYILLFLISFPALRGFRNTSHCYCLLFFREYKYDMKIIRFSFMHAR